jgi:chromosome segregation ATPase
MTVPGNRGIHRFAWDLRGVAATLPAAGGRGGGGGFGGGGGVGPFVAPGTYRAALSRRVGGTTTALGEAQTITVTADPNATLTPAQRTAATEYQDKVAKLQRAFTGALEQANNMKTRTTAIRRAIADSAADIKLLDDAVKFDRRVTEIQRALRGDETLRGLESGSPSTIQSRVNSAAAGARGLTGAPTGTQQTNYTVANEELNAQVAKLRALEGELRKFEQQLEAAGVPYTPGRWPGQ